MPLAAIFAEIGDKAEHAGHMAKIARWFWCGIFGELYGGAFESRFAKDIVEVPAWLDGGPSRPRSGGRFSGRTVCGRCAPAFRRLQRHPRAAHAGRGQDFRSGQGYDMTVFFDEGVDIHHIFPQAWCEAQKIDVKIYDTVINKTPLSYRTNRIIGGVAPSKYLRNSSWARRTRLARSSIRRSRRRARRLSRHRTAFRPEPARRRF